MEKINKQEQIMLDISLQLREAPQRINTKNTEENSIYPTESRAREKTMKKKKLNKYYNSNEF